MSKFVKSKILLDNKKDFKKKGYIILEYIKNLIYFRICKTLTLTEK